MDYPNSPTGYADPDAPTQIANGLSTTTFQYDNNGNVTQKTTDGTTTTYIYDYANRLTALGAAGATTSYSYDAFGTRVLQTGTTTTTIYPFKWYSVASSTGSGAKYATTTEYIWSPSGDTLISTVDQQFASGVATGTARTLYMHPDHLGSTNVVTNASGTVVQTLDYYPYGSTRINTNTGGADSARKYIGQFADQSNLDYLQTRYYDSSRGQFLTQDPVFLGDPRAQNLSDPQSLNAYSYAEDNPTTKKDPNGDYSIVAIAYAAIFLAVAVLALSYGSPSASHGGSGGSSVAGNALRAADQVLNATGQGTGKAIAATTIGIASIFGASPSATYQTTPIFGGIGGTAVTTPYSIDSPYAVTPTTGQQTSIINFAQGGKDQALGKPKTVPQGTQSIETLKGKGVSHEQIENIKNNIGNGPKDWTSV
jgi:RHS repeat-associated protein